MKENQRPKRDPKKAPAPKPNPNKRAAEKLSKPPKDDREITIAPGRGPDVTIG